MDFRISILSGDGIGTVLTQSALDILSAITVRYGHTFKFWHPLVGGIAIETTGVPLPQDTIDYCAKSDAIILGALGGKKYTDECGYDSAKKAISQLTSALNLFINVTPITFNVDLNTSPLKTKFIKDSPTIFVIKESIGNAFKGDHGFKTTKQGEQAYDTEIISIKEIERIAKSAYELAKFKNIPVVSIDMADKTESGKLWRKIITKLSSAYPQIQTTHMLIDEFLMQIGQNPHKFGVILTSNLIGQIICASIGALTGSIDSIANAYIGLEFSLYGSYYANPDSKKDYVNPIGMILSIALMLSQSCKLSEEATAVEKAVKTIIKTNKPLALGGSLNSTKFTELVALEIINKK